MVFETPIQVALKNNDLESLKILFEEVKNPLPKRVPRPASSLATLSTGSYNPYTGYGKRVRKIGVARGGKEGNNAFATDLESPEFDLEVIVRYAFERCDLSEEVLNYLLVSVPDFEQTAATNVVFAIQAGNRKVAAKLVEILVKRDGFGFNFLHHQALAYDGDKEFDEFRRTSVTKKPLENFGVAPLHCAAINPEVKYLKSLLSKFADYNYADGRGRKVIH